MGNRPTRRRWNSSIAVLIAWIVTLVALGSLPGFAGPSYPFGLVTGVLVGPLGAVWAALRARTSGARGVDAVLLACACGFQLALAIAAVAVVHGARAGFCDFVGDFSRLMLGAGIGAFVACFWGVLVAQWLSRRWLVYALALGLPLGGYAVSFGRFYTSPMVFAFDHFAGYFAGTLYDTELGSLGPTLVLSRRKSRCDCRHGESNCAGARAATHVVVAQRNARFGAEWAHSECRYLSARSRARALPNGRQHREDLG